jgi:hypothetical protein
MLTPARLNEDDVEECEEASHLGRRGASSDCRLLHEAPPPAAVSARACVKHCGQEEKGQPGRKTCAPTPIAGGVTHVKSMARSLAHTFAIGAATSALSNVLVEVISACFSAGRCRGGEDPTLWCQDASCQTIAH